MKIFCVTCDRDCTRDRFKRNNGFKDNFMCSDCQSEKLERERMDKVKMVTRSCSNVDALEAEFKALRPEFIDRWRKNDEKRFKMAVRLFAKRKEELLENAKNS